MKRLMTAVLIVIEDTLRTATLSWLNELKERNLPFCKALSHRRWTNEAVPLSMTSSTRLDATKIRSQSDSS